jgi:O-antigen/teichoic acid export membrane protein
MGLSRSVAWNVVGISLPLLLGVAVVPTIIHHLGIERFGCLSIIWTAIGYFSIFDLGLSRTLTKLIADRRGGGDEDQIPALVLTAFTVVVVSGAVIGASLIVSARWIIDLLFSSSESLKPELYAAIVWLAIGLPFVLLATALNGLLEGYERFDHLNIVRVPFGALIYLVPLGALPFGGHLGLITAGTVCVRVLNACALGLSARRVVPGLFRPGVRFQRSLLRPLFNYGGWLTVSNLVGPVMVYFDRFLIAAVLGSSAVAFYTVPYDVLTRLWVVPTAVQGVLFPAFALMRGSGSPRLVEVFSRSINGTLLVMLPILVAGTLLPFEALRVWVGEDFASHSAAVAQILMLGVVINALARYPFTLVQGYGHANWAAFVHLVELPAYALILWMLLHQFGIVGAAYAWTGRICLDAVVFLVLAKRAEPRVGRICRHSVAGLVVISAATILVGSIDLSIAVRCVVIAASVAVSMSLLARGARAGIASVLSSS